MYELQIAIDFKNFLSKHKKREEKKRFVVLRPFDVCITHGNKREEFPL